MTEWKPVTRGAPQGGGLSPHFLNTYVKGLPKAIQSYSMQFADDLTVSEHSKDLQEISIKMSRTFRDIMNFRLKNRNW